MAPLSPLSQPLSTLILLSIAVSVLTQQCFYPNGNLMQDQNVPCSSADGVACCPINWQCLTNGLCYYPQNQYIGRYTCSDKTWKSPGCPGFCTQNGSNGKNYTAAGNEAVLKCSNGRYCCDGDRSFNCCTQQNTAFFDLPDGKAIATISQTNQFPQQTLQEAISSSSTTNPGTSSQPSPPPPPPKGFPHSDDFGPPPHSRTWMPRMSRTPATSSPSPTGSTDASLFALPVKASKGRNVGLIVGVTLGVICAVLALLLAHFVLSKCRQRRDNTKAAPESLSSNIIATSKHPDHGRTWWWTIKSGKARRTSDPDTPNQPTGESLIHQRLSEMPADEPISVVPGHMELSSEKQQSRPPNAFSTGNSPYPKVRPYSTISEVSAVEPLNTAQKGPKVAETPSPLSSQLDSASELRRQAFQIGSFPNSPNAAMLYVFDASTAGHVQPDSPTSPTSHTSLTEPYMYQNMTGHYRHHSYASSGTLADGVGMIPIGATHSIVGSRFRQELHELPADQRMPSELSGTAVEPKRPVRDS